MDPSTVTPEALAMLQALQGQPAPDAGMAPPNPAADPNSPMNQQAMQGAGLKSQLAQQASMGNGGMLGQQAPNMYSPMASPPPMTPPPAPIY